MLNCYIDRVQYRVPKLDIAILMLIIKLLIGKSVVHRCSSKKQHQLCFKSTPWIIHSMYLLQGSFPVLTLGYTRLTQLFTKANYCHTVLPGLPVSASIPWLSSMGFIYLFKLAVRGESIKLYPLFGFRLMLTLYSKLEGEILH